MKKALTMTKHTKDSLIRAVAAETGLTQKDCKAVIEAATAHIGALPVGDSLTLAGFGKFTAKMSTARTGRNPATGGEIQIEPKRRLTFKASDSISN